MTSLKDLPLIDSEDVERCLEFQALFDALEAAFAEFSKGADGGIVQPVRTVVSVDKHQA